MGWANCGSDSKGRPIGYAHPAICDHPGCAVEINRGLAYACGGMHGTSTLGGDDVFDGWPSCEGYFCEEHRRMVSLEHEDGADFTDRHCPPMLCCVCSDTLERAYADPEGDWREHWPTDAPPLTAR